jgi:hypothetical protein
LIRHHWHVLVVLDQCTPGNSRAEIQGEVCMNVVSKLAAPYQGKRTNWTSDDHHLSALNRVRRSVRGIDTSQSVSSDA